MDARQNIVAGANAPCWACSALHCVAADVNISVHKWTCLILKLRWWTVMIYGLQANDVLNVITFDSVRQSVMITVVLKSNDRLFLLRKFVL